MASTTAATATSSDPSATAPTTEDPGGGEGRNLGIIIGSVFGGIAAVAVLAIATYFLFIFFKRKRQTEGSYNPADLEVEQRRPYSIPLPNPERLI